MKLSVLHSIPRLGRITSSTWRLEADENFEKQIGRPPIKDLPTAANVMYTINAIAIAIVLTPPIAHFYRYRHFYRRHFYRRHLNVTTHIMPLQMHTLCHFKCTRYVTSNAYFMSCHFTSTLLLSIPMYTIIQLFDQKSGISLQPLEQISNLHTVNQGGK
jgi:hypothetical protein